MGLEAALAYLDAHINREAVAGRVEGLGLDSVTALLDVLGDPHRAYPVVHVTGTNGKGSVCRLVSALLEAQGLSVGLYTSPHLTSVTERIARDRQPIDDEAFARALEAVAAAEQVAGVVPSYFEILTAAALGWFAEVAVDVAVVEVGLLGRFDATNVVSADVAVVTSVGRDHTDGVGDWRRAVAAEKAGIIDPDSHLVLGPVGDDVVDVFCEPPARERWRFGAEFGLNRDRPAVAGRLIDTWTPYGTHSEVFVPLLGPHQARNAAVALAATEAFFARAVPTETVQAAWAEVAVPGRAEIVGRRPVVLVDAAHNPDGAAALAEVLAEVSVPGRRVWVVGLLEGRDPEVFLAAAGVGPGDVVVACPAPSPRTQPAEALAAAATARGAQAEAAPDVETATVRALALADEDDLVVVTGSVYVVGPVRELLATR